MSRNFTRSSSRPVVMDSLEPRLLLAAQTLIGSGDLAQYLVPTGSADESVWMNRTYDDSAWSAGQTGIGYERSSGYESLIETDVESLMYGTNATCYVRLSFDLSAPAAVEALTLRMKYDDGFVAYLNGQEFASANAPATLAWNSVGTDWHNDDDAVTFVDFDASSAIGGLVPGTNVLAIHGLNATSTTSSDFLILPELVAEVNETTFNVASTEPADESYVSPAPSVFVVHFTEEIDPTSLAASDLQVNGQNATGVTAVDGDTAEFGLPALAAGPHVVTMEENAVTALSGRTLAPHVGDFVVVSSPALIVAAATQVGPSSAMLNAEITDTGWEDPLVTVVWGDEDAGTDPQAWDHQAALGEAGVGTLQYEATGLSTDTEYFYRFLATNTAGTAWTSITGSFTTLPAQLPSVATLDATNILQSSAQLNGEVVDTGGEDPDVHFVWGDEDAGTDAEAWDADLALGVQGQGSFFAGLSDLQAETTYYFTAYATNSAGTSWAPTVKQFEVLSDGPLITEFMAVNDTGLLDEDGDFSDWIEIFNPADAAVGLDGWYLTDDLEDLTRWRMPDVSIAPGGYLVVFASSKDRRDPASELHTNFGLAASGESIALVMPDETTIAHQYEFSPQYADVSYGLTGDLADIRFFTEPTPGSVNGTGVQDLGPAVSELTHTPGTPLDGDDIAVTVRVAEAYYPVDSVTLHYRVMYGSTTSLSMHDDGAHGDGAASDGVYGAVIPASASDPGEMVRWYVTASDTQGNVTRWPTFLSPTSSEEYFGTVIEADAVDTQLPVLHWFVQSPSAANTRTGTRASVYYNGEFYDNIFTRVRGGSTSSKPNPNHKFRFNPGRHFLWDADERRVKEFNLNSNNSDKSYIRQSLAFDLFRETGGESNIAFPMRVEQNGQFYAVHHWIEQTDEDMLERLGMEPDNCALFKVVGNGNGLQSQYVQSRSGIEVKIGGSDEDWDHLYDLATKGNPWGTAGQNWVYDNVNLPSLANYMAVHGLINDRDYGHKNFYPYLNKNTGEWYLLPWDKDLTWGRTQEGGVFSDGIHYDGSGDYPTYPWNTVIFFMYDRGHTELQDMYWRRMRTLLDNYLVDTTWAYDRIDSYYDRMGPDIQMDYEKWADPWWWGVDRHWTESRDLIKDTYIPGRAAYLDGHVDPKTDYVIPGSQPANPTITIDHTVEFNPVSGNQDEEYIRINNPNSYAVDISGWSITGAVEFTFAGGTVIPGNKAVYVTPDVKAFRQRATGPGGGQGNFVVGPYEGHLSNWGETITLWNERGEVRDEHTYAGAPSEWQQGLRITELMYNPADPLGGGYDNDDFEFIELRNIGSTSLDLSGVTLGGGVDYTFTGGQLAAGQFGLLVKDPAAFESRYGAGHNILGTYDGSLSNSADALKLDDPLSSTILDFEYQDNWLHQTDGDGFSLTIIDESANPDAWDESESWRASNHADGTPGADETAMLLPGAIVINELLAHTDELEGDWVELHNTTESDIDVGGWYLSDSDADYKKYRIAAGTVIPAGGYLVLNRRDHFGVLGNPGVNTTFGLSELGEDVYLSSADGTGTITGYQAHEDFGASLNGVSFGRHVKPDGDADFVSMAAATPGAANGAPKVGPVVLSEIMYHPADGETEFIELRNVTATTVPLFDPAWPDHVWQFTDGIEFSFPSGAVLDADATALVVPIDPATFRSQYGVPASVDIYGPYTGALNNAGEKVELSAPSEVEMLPTPTYGFVLVDKVNYEDETPWPVTADGDGPSLVRSDIRAYGNDASNWQAGASGGTPGVPDVTDAASPVVVDHAVILGPNGPLEISATFSEDVDVTHGDLSIVDTSTELPIDTAGMTMSYDTWTSTATWWVGDLAFQSGGEYRAEIAGGIQDASGQAMGSDYTFTFEVQAVPGDVDGDGDADARDIDALVANLGNPAYDVDGDGDADTNDVTYLVETLLGTYYGDANSDQQVTDADYTVWADHYGATGGGWPSGDFNGDGTVSDADYTIWADRYGSGVTAAASASESLAAATAEPAPTAAGTDGGMRTLSGEYALRDDQVGRSGAEDRGGRLLIDALAMANPGGPRRL